MGSGRAQTVAIEQIVAVAGVRPSRGPDPELAAALCVMREERGLTREELASRCGISRDTLARIEAAEVSPAFEVIRRLVAAVGVGLVEVGSLAGLDGRLESGPHGGGRRRHELRRGGNARR
jgi:transcriptional regulator with XRE-family HTH domain